MRWQHDGASASSAKLQAPGQGRKAGSRQPTAEDPGGSLLRARGQSTMEYALVVAVAIAALLAMQTYMKRGVQGKLRDATDQVGEQFSPTAYHGKFKHVQDSATQETLHVGTSQGRGESSSATITIGNVTGIMTRREGMDIGGGVQEKATGGLGDEQCLFCP